MLALYKEIWSSMKVSRQIRKGSLHQPSHKKQKTREEKSNSDFYKARERLLSDAESDRNLHKYNPAKSGVLRFAHKLVSRPAMNNDSEELKTFITLLTNNASEDLEENIEDITILKEKKPECRFIKSIFSTMLHVNQKLPSTTLTESGFNNSFSFPCLFATAKFIRSSCELDSYFVPLFFLF